MKSVDQEDRRSLAKFAGEDLAIVPRPRQTRAAEMILRQLARLAQTAIDERGGARHARECGKRTEDASKTLAIPHLRLVGDDGTYLPERVPLRVSVTNGFA